MVIETGGWADYERLSAWHYLAGPPATVALVFRALCPSSDGRPECAGVLVVSLPTLNGWWRDAAWPGRYTHRRGGPSRESAAANLNADVRTISRVIVDPRYRALGIASSLVRAYLDNPRTPLTEAVAAMGGLCPFFQHAGMTELTTEPDARSLALRSWLTQRGITASDLVVADRAERVLQRPTVEARLRAWCAASIATRASADLPRAGLAAVAAARAWGTRRAYTAEVVGKPGTVKRVKKGVETPGRFRGG